MIFEPFSFRSQPKAVKGLLAAHAAVYLAQWIRWDAVTALLALSPARVTGDLWLWQPFTYLFLHTIGILGFLFFLVHMYMLATLGRDLALRWGSGSFLLYYLACGLAGAATVVVFGRWAPDAVLGSSTVLLGLLAAFATLAPGAQIVFYFMPMTARQLLGLIVLLEVLLSVARLVPWPEAAGHLAGMAAGIGLIRSGIVGQDWAQAWRDWRGRRHEEKGRARVQDLESEVDRILDKVLKQGAGSLTRSEQELMQRYSKSKR